MPRRTILGIAIMLLVLSAALLIWWRFDQDIKLATARAAQGSVLIATRCGPIEYQEAGTGVPLLSTNSAEPRCRSRNAGTVWRKSPSRNMSGGGTQSGCAATSRSNT